MDVIREFAIGYRYFECSWEENLSDWLFGLRINEHGIYFHSTTYPLYGGNTEGP